MNTGPDPEPAKALAAARAAIGDFNADYCPAGGRPPRLSGLYDLFPDDHLRPPPESVAYRWPDPYPMRDEPVVYVFLDPRWNLLYVGRASTIDGRFKDYFKYDRPGRGCLVKKPGLWTARPQAFFVAAAPDRVVAPLEEYLLWRLRPPSNKSVPSSPPARPTLER